MTFILLEIIYFLGLFYFLIVHFYTCNSKQRDKVLQKFTEELLKICYQERIFVEYFDNVFELNDISKEEGEKLTSTEVRKMAAGWYRTDEIHQVNGNGLKAAILVESRLPRIGLVKDPRYTAYIIAHELGHHFLRKMKWANNEVMANNYIMVLAKRCLTGEEQLRIRVSLEGWSETSLDIKNERMIILKYYIKKLFNKKG